MATNRLKTILRPWFGFVTLQPIILTWFWLFSDNLWETYQQLGWPLQIICTIYLIPVYEIYEKYYPKSLSISDTPEDT